MLELLGFFPVVAIVGPRQVGKTTLAKDLLTRMGREAVYLDLENPEDEAKLTDPVLFFKTNIDRCVVLDEIQRMPQLFPILRSMVDIQRQPARFLLLGSATPDLIRNSSESLAGRISYRELTPFNLTEVDHETRDDMLRHWFRGGFPDAYLAPTDRMTVQWHTSFIQTYVERDLPMLGLDIDRTMIRKLWTMVAHIHGNVLNMSNLGRSLGVTSVTVKKYLAFLEGAFLIRQLQPWYVNLGKRLVKAPKIYVRDTGALHRLLGIASTEALQMHPSLGASWEGYAIEQIIQLLPDDMEPYFYRTHEGAECDLVLIRSGQPVASIEVKYTSAPRTTKGITQSFTDLGTAQNFIITPDTDNYQLTENVRVSKLSEFLTDHLPLIVGS
ncbi:MAG: ATP-binding protein [Flavobacteriales bacterium]|nr:ATP-binding protein [Flavobacteriales bacterium]